MIETILIVLAIIAGVTIASILAIIAWGIGIYNTLISARQDIKNQVGNIQTEYSRRLDLFKNLVETVKSSIKFEKSTLVELTQARAGVKNASLGKLNEIEKTLSKIIATVEAYPNLKTVKLHAKLMDEIRITEDRINIARTDYNATVNDFNTFATTFPNNLVAGKFGFKVEAYYVSPKATDEAPQIDLKV